MIRKPVFIIFLSSLTLMGFSEKKDKKGDDEKALIARIDTRHDQFQSFFLQTDADSISNVFSSKCYFSRPNQDILQSREEVAKYLKAEFSKEKKYRTYELRPVYRKVYDDLILEAGTSFEQFSIGAEKRLYTEEYNYMFVWKLTKKGNLKIRSAFWNTRVNPCPE
jgi:nuclear transport factor 2 (NTF2) superfamily protein